jgi:hypothetical protein
MEKMKVHIMIEVLGRPPENVKEALQNISTRIGAEKGIKVLAKEIHEPIAVPDAKDLYTSFVEMDLEIDNLQSYLNILFTYMPSNIEFISPEVIELKNTFMNEISHAISQRLHHYDSIAKQMLTEKEILLKQLFKYAPHLFKKKEPQQPVQQVPPVENKKVKKEEKKTKKAKLKKNKK